MPMLCSTVPKVLSGFGVIRLVVSGIFSNGVGLPRAPILVAGSLIGTFKHIVLLRSHDGILLSRPGAPTSQNVLLGL